MKYNKKGIPHRVCLQQMYLEAGGSKKGKGWWFLSVFPELYYTKKHVQKVNNLSRSSWSLFSGVFGTSITKKEYKEKIEKIMENIQMADKFYLYSLNSIRNIPIGFRFSILVARRIYRQIGYEI
jgi:hypothetical protein